MKDKYLKLSPEEWLIQEKGFSSQKQGMYESIFTLGNGYLSVRGSLEENPIGNQRGVFMAGIFDQAESFVTELVKIPGWVDLSVWVDDKKFSVDNCRVLTHERVLDLKKGILHRLTRLKDKSGRILKIESQRIVFAHQVRGAVIKFLITPENFSGRVKVISGINGEVTNNGYFPHERIKHLNLVSMKREKNLIYLEMETRDNKTRVALAANMLFKNQKMSENVIKVNRFYGEKMTQEITFDAKSKKTYEFIKWISTYTSREGYEQQLEGATTDLLADMSYEGLSYHLKKHLREREKLWQVADIQITGDKVAQKGIRFNIYHLLAAKPHHDQTVSIGAKFLTGEGYRGHAFWDTEIFILPFYIYTFPEEARGLLMYRYYTLKGARQNAMETGFAGAKYAWESADSGLETTPPYGLRFDGTHDKIFTGEEEHHIVADIPYAIFKYLEASHDHQFIYKYGAEIIFETARFWASRVIRRRERYEVRKVIGPDEFHEHVDNNAFTSYLARFNLNYAVEVYQKMRSEAPEILREISEKIKLKEAEISHMKEVADNIFIPYSHKKNLMEQFEGYFSLENHTIKKSDKNGFPLFPKGVKPHNLDRTQLIKQADVVLLLYLFLDHFSAEEKKRNYDYYEKRTMHHSSLSPCTYAIMGLETGDHKKAYRYFIKTSYIDLENYHKNTAEGIHAAATGGAWMTVIHGFAGMKVRQGRLTFNPWLPKRWQSLSYRFYWHGNLLEVKITHKMISFKILHGRQKKVSLKVGERLIFVTHQKISRVSLSPKSLSRR